MALLLIRLLELRGVQSSWLWALGICLLLGRVLHAISLLTNGVMWGRLAGMVLTLNVLSVAGVLCIAIFFLALVIGRLRQWELAQSLEEATRNARPNLAGTAVVRSGLVITRPKSETQLLWQLGGLVSSRDAFQRYRSSTSS